MIWNDHTFVVCAYGESPYLEACVKSLLNQRLKSQILIATSTPNDIIRNLAKKYDLKLLIREGESGLAADWNFAYDQAKTAYVTLAHQDDVYGKSYLQEICKAVREARHPLLLFTDYSELRGGRYEPENELLRMKRLLLFPLKFACFQRSVWVRRRVLSLGNPICCPAVTYAKNSIPSIIFTEGFSSNTDWEAWERLSVLKGSFIYIPRNCMAHRIHEGSTTTRVIGETGRKNEDYAMLQKFWPDWAAAWIERIYKRSEELNSRGE